MSASTHYRGRPTVGFSKPYRDPAQIGRKNTPDWLVSEIGETATGRYATQHRFTAEQRARDFASDGQKVLAQDDERVDYDDRDHCEREADV